MNLGLLLISCTLVTGEEPVVLDAFHYPDAKAASGGMETPGCRRSRRFPGKRRGDPIWPCPLPPNRIWSG